MTDRAAVETALVDAHQQEWAFLVAATVRAVRDLDLAEDCVQEAYAAALPSWTENGVPDNPAAWLTTAAKRRGIDAIRRDRTLRIKLPLLVEPEDTVEDAAMEELFVAADHTYGVPDEVVALERLD